jgi:hypothetical protein
MVFFCWFLVIRGDTVLTTSFDVKYGCANWSFPFLDRQWGDFSVKRGFMLGIEDKYVSLAYVLCLLSTLLCVVYGLINWNRGSNAVDSDDVRWAEEEKKVEQEL